MRRFLVVAVLILATVAVASANGQWTPKNYAGQTMGTNSAAGDTSTFARAHFDTARMAQASVTGTITVDTLAVTGVATLSKLSVTVLEVAQSDSSTVYGLDTTLTGAGASSRFALPYDERDPNRLGRYTDSGDLVSDLPAAITDEMNGAIWRDEGLKWPINGILHGSVRGDSLTVRRGDNGAVVLRFRPVAGGVLTTTTPGITDVAYLDRVLYVTGVDSVGLTRINLRTGVVDKWLATGYYKWNGALSERNSNKGWTLVSATPALNDARVNSVGVMRSPWSSPSGHYVTVGTLKGTSTWIMAADGTVSICDAVTTSPVRDVEVLPDGQMVASAVRNQLTSLTNSSWESASISGTNILLATNSSASGLLYGNGIGVVSGRRYTIRYDVLKAKSGTTNGIWTRLAYNGAAGDGTDRAKSVYLNQLPGGAGRVQYSYVSDTTGTVYFQVYAAAQSDTLSLRNISISSGSDSLYYTQSALATTADSRAPDAIYYSGATGGLGMPFDSTASFNTVSALPHASAAGRDGSRFFVGTDSGLVVIDNKPGDAAGGMRQVIRKSYVEPMAVFSGAGSPTISGPVAMFSPASSAFLVGTFSTGGTGVAPTYAVTNDGPLSHAWTFNGTTQFLAADGLLDSLANDVKGTINLWAKPADGQPAAIQYLVTIGDTDGNSYFMLRLPTNGIPTASLVTSGTTQWFLSPTGGGFANGAAEWRMLTVTHNGDQARFYVNGDSVSQTLTTTTDVDDWIADVSAADNVRIGALNYNAGGNTGLYTGSLTGIQFYSRALSRTEIRAIYEAGRPFIESPTPDTLTVSDRIQFSATDWLSGRTLVGDSSRVELRGRYGALIDTFMCTGCGQLYSAQFKRTPSADSLNIVIAGATGLRVIGQNPKLTDFAASEWPREEYWVGNGPVVADSSGAGHVWKVQDAINMAYAAGRKVVEVVRGTYDWPVSEVYTGMTLRGRGLPLITNAADTSKAALTVTTGDSVTIENVRVYTAPGGAGNSKAAITISSGADVGTLRQVDVVNSDTWGIGGTSGARWTYENCLVRAADTYGIYLGPHSNIQGGRYNSAGVALLVADSCASVMQATFSGAASPVKTLADADSLRFIGNNVLGGVGVANGVVKAAFIGNRFSAALQDSGTGTIEANNIE